MNALTKLYVRADVALKAFTMRFAGRVSSWSSLLLPRTRFDYAREVGDGLGSSLVVACLFWVGRTFPEAPIRVQRIERDQTLVPQPAHPMITLLAEPNPYYSGELLMMATVIDLWATGNAYWLKSRSRAGRPVELWYAPSGLIEPRWPDDGSQFISHYEYTPDPSRPGLRVEPDDLVHFRFGIDPRNTRKGFSPLASLFREIFTDDEAANFTAALLKNLGIPGLILSPKGDATTNATPEQAEAVKQTAMAKFGGDRRGEPMIMLSPTDVSVLGFSPQQMNLRDLRRIPEERVTAVLGIPAVVVGLGAGLDRSTFANMAEAREAAYESALLPMQRIMAGEIRRQLLRDFGDARNLLVDFDTSNVRVLQEDETSRVERANLMLASGAITVAEYRSRLGLPTDASHDIYLRPLTLIEVPVGGQGRTLLPLAEPAALPAPKMRPSGTKAIDPDRYLARIDRERDALLAPYARDLEAAFRAVADEVLAALDAQQARTPELVMAGYTNGHGEKASLPDLYDGLLTGAVAIDTIVRAGLVERHLVPVFRRFAARIGERIVGVVAETLGVELPWRPDEPLAARLIREGGTRAGLVDLDQQTRDALRRAIADGIRDGDSTAAITRRIRRYVEGDALYPGIAADAGSEAARAWRAQTIAQTEIAWASNLATVAAARASGVVAGLRCVDGPDCGVTSHDDPQRANGRLFTFEEAEAYPLAHPNCQRRFHLAVIGDA